MNNATDKVSNPEIAKTIIAQLPRGAFMMMGAKNLIDHGDGLSWKVGRNAKGVTHVKVTLAADDTYTVTFSRYWGHKYTLKAELTMVYADQLRETIEANTGLYLNL